MPPDVSLPSVICCCSRRGAFSCYRGHALLVYAVESIAAPDDVTALRELAREFYSGEDLERLEALLDRREEVLRCIPRAKRRALALVGS